MVSVTSGDKFYMLKSTVLMGFFLIHRINKEKRLEMIKPRFPTEAATGVAL